MITTIRKRTTKTYGLKGISNARRESHNPETRFIALSMVGGSTNELVDESIRIDYPEMDQLVRFYSSITTNVLPVEFVNVLKEAKREIEACYKYIDPEKESSTVLKLIDETIQKATRNENTK